ncbi:MAG TPA: hypothetical protein VFZ61_34705 [Polyangiales bacterium]
MSRSILRKRACQLLSALCLAWLSGCTHTLVVQAPTTLPARVPVYVFPSVWVAGGDGQEEIYLLDRVASHLSRDRRREVRRLELAELEPARQAGRISPLTCVVLLKLNFRDESRDVTNTVPTQYCGMYGCGMVTYHSYQTQIPVLVGEATLTVFEGPTARELSREPFREQVDGERSDDARYAVVERLADALTRGIDLSVGRQRFDLEESGIEQGDEAVAALASGQFKQAEEALEQLARTGLGGQKIMAQARVWHALGIARLLETQPLPPTAQTFVEAERALKLAYQLSPDSLRQRALETLALWRKQQSVLAEQQYAWTHNFELARQAAGAQTAP